jgi:hypothetical protein
MEKCFSIIYGQERAIDLMIADDHISREDIIKTVEALFAAYSTAKRIVSKDVLLLRTVWLECDKVSANGKDHTYVVALVVYIEPMHLIIFLSY